MNLSVYKKRLLDRKKTLEAHDRKSRDSRAPVELDQTRQGRLTRQDALMQQSMADATYRARSQEVQKIKWALARIESGDYGLCVCCEEPIETKRLDNDPSVPTCIGCAS